MNVAKNWALAIMSIALTFAHFSSRANCCWKSEWLSLLKKTFTNAGHVDAKLIDFSEICQRKTQRNRLFFTDCFLAKFPLEKFPWNRPIFLRICPRKSFEIWLFSAKIPRNGWFFCEFAPENLAKFCLFFREISEALSLPFDCVMSSNGSFSYSNDGICCTLFIEDYIQ